MTKEQKETCKFCKDMIESCFTYGGATKDNYNFAKYILPYKDKLGSKLFNSIYKKHLAKLQKEYKVLYNTSTDFEGLAYNSLVKK